MYTGECLRVCSELEYITFWNRVLQAGDIGGMYIASGGMEGTMQVWNARL